MLRRHFLTGLLVLAPTVVTGWIVYKIFITMDSMLDPLQRRFPLIDLPGIGFIGVLLLIWFTGLLASNLIGRRIFSLGEKVMNGIPLIRRIYTAIKEISEVFLTDKKTAFRRVVLIRYPHEKSYALAFVTKEGVDYFDRLTDDELVNVFLPTTPNPTSGLMLMLPKRDVLTVDITVEEAMKIVISGGAFAPALLERQHTRQTN
ncbi:MAG: DUF502 domain-containing protein [bacterium]|nr:DUF502 domain-containing protein [bacterium]